MFVNCRGLGFGSNKEVTQGHCTEQVIEDMWNRQGLGRAEVV